jgi:hypothetical protein
MGRRIWAIGWAAAAAALLAAAGCSGDDSDGEGGQSADGPDCGEYCDTVMASCTGGNAVYVSREICMSACATFPKGAKADTSGNTLGCRTYHAGAAAGSEMNAATHCPHAGPGGAGYCGENCDGYCSLVLSACPDVYTDMEECMVLCSNFPDQEPFSASVVTGNTLQCRLYHASVATTDRTHCDHVGVSPSPGTCVDSP